MIVYGHEPARFRLITEDSRFARRLKGRNNRNLGDKWRKMVSNDPAVEDAVATAASLASARRDKVTVGVSERANKAKGTSPLSEAWHRGSG